MLQTLIIDGQYYINEKFELRKGEKLIATKVRSLNNNGYIVGSRYYDFDGTIIPDAKMLSYRYVLTYDGDVHSKTSIIATGIKKITNNGMALTNDGYLYDMLYMKKYDVDDMKVDDIVDNGFITYAIRGNKYFEVLNNYNTVMNSVDTIERKEYCNIHHLFMGNLINPLYDIRSIYIMVLWLKRCKLRAPKQIMFMIFRLNIVLEQTSYPIKN